MSMDEQCTEEQILALENIYDELDLDNLQQQVINAAGRYWAEEINCAIAHLEYEIREAIRDMRKEADL